MKRMFDILISLGVILLGFPFLILVSIAIFFTDGRPIFFMQERVGESSKAFYMYKFRSMCKNAEKIGSYRTETNDPRITKIGRFLRRTSIDELPQLYNVLKGDMSIVGPRPNVFAQKHLYTQLDWYLRHSVKPGITGLAQATLRSAATEAQRLQMDLEYASNPNFLIDLKIIVMTVKQIVIKGGN